MQFTCEMFHPNSKISLLKLLYKIKYISAIKAIINYIATLKFLSVMNMKSYLFFFCFLVYADGRVCISILHAPGDDPMGYESSAERWSPVQSVEKILLSVVSMLAEPNDESGANVDAAKMWREDRKEFERIAQKLVRKTLGIPP